MGSATHNKWYKIQSLPGLIIWKHACSCKSASNTQLEKLSLSNWLSLVRNMLTSLVTYYLVDEKLKVTKDLDILYTRAQCGFQAMNQSKVLSSIVCKFSAKVLENNSPAICSCGADQNCPNSSVSTRSPSSIKELSVWEGFCTWSTNSHRVSRMHL